MHFARSIILPTISLLTRLTSTSASQAPLTAMSSDLRTWTQSRLSALYSAHADDTFASAYAQAFAPDVKMAFADAPQGDATGQSQVVAGEGTREERMEGEEARKALEARAKGGAQASTAQVEFGEMNVEPGADEVRTSA